ncbi:MAG: anion permease, partial [Candidatus Nitrosocaldus sp.]
MNIKIIGLIIGPLLFLLILVAPTPTGLSEEGKIVLAIASWMIVWWITEAISVYATALLPLALLPIMGVLPLTSVASEYMHPIVVLLLGMFLIAISIEKSG